MLRFILVAVIFGTVFSFGAIVQAYAGEGSAVTAAPIDSDPISIKAPSGEEDKCIQGGDTLWDIASSHKKDGEHLRSYVEQLKACEPLIYEFTERRTSFSASLMTITSVSMIDVYHRDKDVISLSLCVCS